MTTIAQDLANAFPEPDRVAGELRDYRSDADALSSAWARLVERYPHKWVAFSGGEVVAAEHSLEAALAELRRLDVSPARTPVRYVDADPKSVIL